MKVCHVNHSLVQISIICQTFHKNLFCYSFDLFKFTTKVQLSVHKLCRIILDCTMLEITCNDRLGKKVRVKCNPDDTIGDLKKLIAAQTGTRYDKIVLKKWYTIYKDNIRLSDCKYIKLHLIDNT